MAAAGDAPKQNIEVYIDPAGTVTFQFTSRPVGHYAHTRVFPGITEARIATAKIVTARREVWSELGKRVKHATLADVLPATT